MEQYIKSDIYEEFVDIEVEEMEQLEEPEEF